MKHINISVTALTMYDNKLNRIVNSDILIKAHKIYGKIEMIIGSLNPF